MPQPSFYGAIIALSQDPATALTAEQSQKIVELMKAAHRPQAENGQAITSYCLSLLTAPQLEWLSKNKNAQVPAAGATDAGKGDPTLLAAIHALGTLTSQDPERVPLLTTIPSVGQAAVALMPEDLAHGLVSADKMPKNIAIEKEQAIKLMAALRTLNALRLADMEEKSGVLKVLTDSQKSALIKLGGTPGGNSNGARPTSQEDLLNQLTR